jgi:uncharacterized membrane protein SirB2
VTDVALLELYPLVRHAHVGLVAVSGVLFALRGIGVLAGAGWSMRRPVRLLSQAIDTALLGAALLLLHLLQLNPFVIPWLATKLALLAAYIVLGSFALKRARSGRGARAVLRGRAVGVRLHDRRGAGPPPARLLQSRALSGDAHVDDCRGRS